MNDGQRRDIEIRAAANRGLDALALAVERRIASSSADFTQSLRKPIFDETLRRALSRRASSRGCIRK